MYGILCSRVILTRWVLLHYPALQSHRDTHNIESLEHLWERPEEVVGFLRDASVL